MSTFSPPVQSLVVNDSGSYKVNDQLFVDDRVEDLLKYSQKEELSFEDFGYLMAAEKEEQVNLSAGRSRFDDGKKKGEDQKKKKTHKNKDGKCQFCLDHICTRYSDGCTESVMFKIKNNYYKVNHKIKPIKPRFDGRCMNCGQESDYAPGLDRICFSCANKYY